MNISSNAAVIFGIELFCLWFCSTLNKTPNISHQPHECCLFYMIIFVCLRKNVVCHSDFIRRFGLRKNQQNRATPKTHHKLRILSFINTIGIANSRMKCVWNCFDSPFIFLLWLAFVYYYYYIFILFTSTHPNVFWTWFSCLCSNVWPLCNALRFFLIIWCSDLSFFIIKN